MPIYQIYQLLHERYGPQGWWPLTKRGFRPKHHSGKPANDKHRFEIFIGAILTQNTNWRNVEKALYNLSKNKLIDPTKIIRTDIAHLANLVKPSGYYNQKAERLKLAAEFFLANKNPTRDQLLELKGIGPETADSILLYAYNKPFFVIDAYTRRIFERLGHSCRTYDEWQEVFKKKLPNNPKIFDEYHALIVEHAKSHCKKIPEC